MSRPVALTCYAIAIMFLAWPMLLNGDYIYFYDTTAYLQYPAHAFRIIFGIGARISSPDPAGISGTVAPGIVPGGGAADQTVAAGRSIYYGAMLYTGQLISDLWIGILFQLACVVLAIHMTLISLLGSRQQSFPVVVLVLAIATPLSFFVCYLMPDVFAGIAILAIANLFAGEGRLPLWTRAFWLALLATSLLFHTSHTAVALLIMIPAAILSWILLRRPPWKGAATVALAIGIALVGEGLFALVVEAVYGAPPLRPPFLMARMLSDGPGHAYLTENCPGIGLRICDFLSGLPRDSDEFLWSQDPGTGLYNVVDAATRQSLAAEQMRFVIGVVTFDPLGQIVASLHDFGEQLGRFGLSEFAYSDPLRRMLAARLPPGERAAFLNSALYRGTFPLRPADVLVRLTFVASVLYLCGKIGQAIFRIRRHIRSPDRELLLFAVILIGGVVANAAVTGILSTPHDRYQARVIWLVPLLAMIVFLRTRTARPAVAQ